MWNKIMYCVVAETIHRYNIGC